VPRRIASLTILLLLSAAAPAGAQSGTPRTGANEPRHQLLGDWRLSGGGSYTFSQRRGRVQGRSRRTLRLGGCRIRKGAVVFRGYRFSRRRGGRDIWRGRVAFLDDGCRRVYVPSTITIQSDLRFTETAKLDGRRRRAAAFTRIRPRVSPDDPVVATWIRNEVGVILRWTQAGFEGRARESYRIGNGCTVPAGTVVWRLRPLAPGRYDGTVQAFRNPPGCRAGQQPASRWRLDAPGRLVRVSAEGEPFAYLRG
jgi:hypothetical protein